MCEIFDTTPNRLLTDKHTSPHPGDPDTILPDHEEQKRRYDVSLAYQGGLLSEEEMERIVQEHTK